MSKEMNRIYGRLAVEICGSRAELGRESAGRVARNIKEIVARKGEARIVLASGASQVEFFYWLCRMEGVPWDRVVAFYLDEYVGASPEDAHSLGRFIEEHLFSKVNPGTVHYIYANVNPPEQECARYGRLITEKEFDLACLGIGENGHLAFNEPHAADFKDPLPVKVVELDEICRRQQIRDFGFKSMAEVPRQAITITIPPLLKAGAIFCMVPGAQKAEIVRRSLLGPVEESCPASILRTHCSAVLFLDADSAAGLD